MKLSKKYLFCIRTNYKKQKILSKNIKVASYL